MMPYLRNLALALVLPAWLAAAPAGAAEERPLSDVPKDKKTWLDARASELKGKKVVNPEGKALGEIDDLIIDVRRSTVPALALSSGGVAGMAEKLTLVPAKAFTRGEVFDRLVLDMDEQRLRSLPGLEKRNQSEPSEPGLHRASDLMGKNVKDPQGKSVGEIEDFVVNLGTGRVEQVVYAPNGRKAPEPKDMLALKAFTIPAERGGDIVLKQAR